MNTTVTQAGGASRTGQHQSNDVEKSGEEVSFPFAAVLAGTKALVPPAEAQKGSDASHVATPDPAGQKPAVKQEGTAHKQLVQLLADLAGKSTARASTTADASGNANATAESTGTAEAAAQAAKNGSGSAAEESSETREGVSQKGSGSGAAAQETGRPHVAGSGKAASQKASEASQAAAGTPTRRGSAPATSPEPSTSSPQAASSPEYVSEGEAPSSKTAEPSAQTPHKGGGKQSPLVTAAAQEKAKQGASSDAPAQHQPEDEAPEHETKKVASPRGSGTSDRNPQSGSREEGSGQGGGHRQQQGRHAPIQLTHLQQQLGHRPGSDNAASTFASPEQLQDVSTADAAMVDDKASGEEAREAAFSSRGTNKAAAGNASRPGEAPGAQLRKRWTQAARARTLHAGGQNGDWKQLDMELPGRDGTMQLMAQRRDQEIAVSVRFSDPGIRAALEGQVEQVRQALQAEYDAPVDFSLMDDDGEAAFADDREHRSGGASPGASSGSEAEENNPSDGTPRLRSLSNHEWIG